MGHTGPKWELTVTSHIDEAVMWCYRECRSSNWKVVGKEMWSGRSICVDGWDVRLAEPLSAGCDGIQIQQIPSLFPKSEILASSSDHATNPHPNLNPSDLANEICIQRKWSLAGLVTSLSETCLWFSTLYHQPSASLSPIQEAFVAGASTCGHQTPMQRKLEVG